MFTPADAIELARYSDWADRVLFKAMEALPDGAAEAETNTLFGSMLGTLNHNYQVDLIWRAHLLGEAHGFTTRRNLLHPTMPALIQAQLEVNRWYIDWAAAQSTTTLAERLRFTYVTGDPGEMSRGGMLAHIVNHKTYHRGWVCQMFFGHGLKPPETDLCIFLCAAAG